MQAIDKTESCASCKHRCKIERYDYSHGGCEHSEYDGYGCTVFLDEGVVIHMVGLGEKEKCECWERKDT